ncbi:type II secretion system protein F [Ruminiclostridium hungatei]|uniref:Type II secretion system protein F n=1 Tax=Ruminiclostridium hungatei TaxID=48256 RepID=A0A1V4SGN9_RUMHU|nr:type II secretion system F family protein [Ruminiclostridium hungatei]OPX43030.1 type II secretion system protein F [Ruminiclostridium hungatei]
MPIYEFKARNIEDKILEGRSKFSSKESLAEQLELKGYILVEAKELNAFTDISQISIFKQRVKVKDLAIFCRQFAIILEAGVPIATALDVLKEQTTNITLRDCISDIYEDIQKGTALSVSMKKHDNLFPEILIYMVESGELSGMLDKTFSRMAEHFEKENRLHQKIKSAMTYPAIVLLVAVAVIFVLMVNVVPSFSSILGGFGVEVPIFTKVLISISSFFQSFWWLMIGILLGAVAGFSRYRKTDSGRHLFGNLAIKLPIVKQVTRNVITARFSRTMGTLMASGVLIIQALEVVQKLLGNIIIEEKIDLVIEDIKQGKGLSQPLAAMKYFPPMMVSMIRIGEESGNLDYSLDKAADFFDEEVETSVQQLTSLIEPIIVIFLAVIVAFVILSILYPMMSIYQNMSV